MNQDELETLIVRAIQSVAPEIERADIDPEEDLREVCDLDSMDFLNVLEALKKSSGVSIPEADYFKVNTLAQMSAYIEARLDQAVLAVLAVKPGA